MGTCVARFPKKKELPKNKGELFATLTVMVARLSRQQIRSNYLQAPGLNCHVQMAASPSSDFAIVSSIEVFDGSTQFPYSVVKTAEQTTL